VARRLLNVSQFGCRGITIMDIGDGEFPDEREKRPQEEGVDQAAPRRGTDGSHDPQGT
jgi:hypothetical protein